MRLKMSEKRLKDTTQNTDNFMFLFLLLYLTVYILYSIRIDYAKKKQYQIKFSSFRWKKKFAGWKKLPFENRE